ncbi:response regulator transcription factor [uncultured Thiodictyon sp.]|uniref:response regulator transcription factor n=1 Tax=uncultured Thiodictyon sp. TaxID=1846217 RepID=UPI0025DF4A26|nr:response regulator transcription factor [uncultured Thiodictyon sp.]
MTIRVVLADDHMMVREALAGMLDTAPGVEVVGVAADGREALAQVEALRPDVLILDVRMPDLNGIEAAMRMRKLAPRCRVLALSALGEECFVKQMVEAGAKGYVLKSEPLTTLVEAVRQVYAGGTWLPTPSGSPTPTPTPTPIRPGRTLFSRREREVLVCLAAGQRGSQIAEQLGVAVKTVDTYRRRMMAKLGLQSQAELVRYAVTLGGVTPCSGAMPRTDREGVLAAAPPINSSPP